MTFYVRIKSLFQSPAIKLYFNGGYLNASLLHVMNTKITEVLTKQPLLI